MWKCDLTNFQRIVMNFDWRNVSLKNQRCFLEKNVLRKTFFSTMSNQLLESKGCWKSKKEHKKKMFCVKHFFPQCQIKIGFKSSIQMFFRTLTIHGRHCAKVIKFPLKHFKWIVRNECFTFFNVWFVILEHFNFATMFFYVVLHLKRIVDELSFVCGKKCFN